MCYCGLSESYENCCKPFHKGADVAPTAERLMRSRYSAFVAKEFDYLEKTQDPQTTLNIDHEGNRKWAEQAEFQKLEIINSSEEKNKGTVEFKAYFKQDGQDHVHHELSKFRKQNGQWYFREGRTKS